MRRSGPGVYRMIGAEGEVLYVGKARSIKKRIAAYMAPERQSSRIARMVAQTRSMVFVTTETEAEALLLEANLIKQLKPRYNVVLRDDKSFPYILICTGHRGGAAGQASRRALDLTGDYFGPFASAGAVFRTMNALQRAFLLRTCSDSYYENRTRPCLLHQIKRCSGPCTGEIALDDYAELVEEARDFLSGRSRAIRRRLADDMSRGRPQRSNSSAPRGCATASGALRDPGRAERQSALDPRGRRVRGRRGGGAISASRCSSSAPTRTGATAPISRAPTGRSGRRRCSTRFWRSSISSGPPRASCCSATRSRAPATSGRGLERARRPSHRHRRAAAGREEGPRRRRDAQRARGAVAQARGSREPGEAHRRARARPSASRQPIRRVEIYDNSHIMGTNAIGAMVVAGPEGFVKNAVPHLQHQERRPHARRRLRDDARGADAALRAAEAAGRDGRGRRLPRHARPRDHRRRPGPVRGRARGLGRARRRGRGARLDRQGPRPQRRPRDVLRRGPRAVPAAARAIRRCSSSSACATRRTASPSARTARGARRIS